MAKRKPSKHKVLRLRILAALSDGALTRTELRRKLGNPVNVVLRPALASLLGDLFIDSAPCGDISVGGPEPREYWNLTKGQKFLAAYRRASGRRPRAGAPKKAAG